MIDDLAPSKGKTLEEKTGAKTAKKKGNSISITVSHEKSTKQLLDELVWLKQYVIDQKAVTQGDIVREALELLGKEIGYDKLRKKYADKLADVKPKVGRKSR